MKSKEKIFSSKVSKLDRPFWIYTIVSFFKTFSPLLVCVLKILNILNQKKKKNTKFGSLKLSLSTDWHIDRMLPMKNFQEIFFW